jgi:hypothetical protein
MMVGFEPELALGTKVKCQVHVFQVDELVLETLMVIREDMSYL